MRVVHLVDGAEELDRADPLGGRPATTHRGALERSAERAHVPFTPQPPV